MSSFHAVIVNNVEARLPARMRRFAEVAFALRTLDMQTQFEQHDRTLWRDIESYVHPPA
jgi:hypothetical protein